MSKPGIAPITANNSAVKKLILIKEVNALIAPISMSAQAAPSMKLVSFERVPEVSLVPGWGVMQLLSRDPHRAPMHRQDIHKRES